MPDQPRSGGARWTLARIADLLGRWRRPLAVAALVIAVGAAVWSVTLQWQPLTAALAQLSWWTAPASLAVTAVGVLATAASWRVWLRGLGVRLPAPAATRLFLITQVGKYVPGSIWPFLAQAAAGRAFGVPATTFPAATGLFAFSHVATGLALGGLALLADGQPWWGVLALVVAVPALLPPAARRLIALSGRRNRGTSGGQVGDGAGGHDGNRSPGQAAGQVSWRGHGYLFLAWACYGVGFHLLARELLDQPVGLLTATGVFALAWVAGFLIVIAPAGAGPREAVMIALLAGVGGSAPALALALVSRVLMTVADVVLALLAAVLIAGPAPVAAAVQESAGDPTPDPGDPTPDSGDPDPGGRGVAP